MISSLNQVIQKLAGHVSRLLNLDHGLVLGLLILSIAPADAADQISLQLKWHHQFQFAGYYAAQAKGFYQQENLDVRIIEGGSDRPSIDQVLSGAAQYGVGDSDILPARASGKPLVAIASTFQHAPYVLLSLREKQIRTPADLIGKRVMLSDNQGATQFRAMMFKEGISADKVEILPHSWSLDDLITGKVDAISAYATVEPARLSAMGYEPAIMRSQDYGADFYGDILFTTEAEIAEHPQRVAAFLRATKKGWIYAYAHPEEVASLIAAMKGVAGNGIIREMLLAEARDMAPYVMIDVVEPGHMNLGRWKVIAKTLAELNLIPADYDLEGFIYIPEPRFEYRLLGWIGAAVALILVLFGMVLLWNFQIRNKVRERTIELQNEIHRRENAEELLKIAGNTARLGGWVLDIQTGKMTWSDEVAKIHDVGVDETPSPEDGIRLFVPEHQPVIRSAVDACVRDGTPYDLELEKTTVKGRRIWVRTIGQAVRGPDGGIVRLQGSFQDITERKRLEAFKAGQHGILERIATSEPLSEILTATVALIEAQFPNSQCSVMLLDNDGVHMRQRASISLSKDYLELLDGMKIGRSSGFCGVTAYENRRVIVNDFAESAEWGRYGEYAIRFGLRACCSTPILSSKQRVLGTLILYYTERHTPSEEERELVDACSRILGIAIERHQSEDYLHILESAIARLNDIVMITDAGPSDGDGPRIVYVNDAFERVTGYSREEAIGKSPRMLQGANTQKEELLKIRQALKAWQPVRSELINYKKSGEEMWLELEIIPISDASGWYTNWVAVERDVTQRKQAEIKIQFLAFYDSMTNLPNRQLLLDRLEQRLVSTVRTHHSGAVLFIDLDNFKMLNDTYGHDVGDILLKEVAQRIVNCVRASDTVSRLGGDEFVVVVDELDENLGQAADQIRVVCQKILNSFKQPFILGSHVHYTTPSIGVTLFNGATSTTVDELLRRADLAMYKAKDSGRNCYRFFDQHMQLLVSERVQMEEDMRVAIAEGQFVLHYQAQLDRERGIIGAEGLIRWNHPKRGLVMPVQFISLAEDSDLILEIGNWVLKTACEQLLKWAGDKQTEHLVLSINVSARQCLRPDFVEQVVNIIDSTGANPAKLMLELTESILLDNVEDIITKMNALKAKGVGFSLDDFGTGYSSLSYLKLLPLDQLKIDRSFVRDVMIDSDDASIVRTIISLGLILEMEVLAEGVENEDQLQFLLHHGCHTFQGYLFGRPVKVEDLEAAINQGKLRNI